MQTIEHKRGTTLSYTAQLSDEDTGAGVDLTGSTVKAELRSRAGLALAATAVVTVDPDQTTHPGRFTLEVDATTTEGWTAGDVLLTDVRIVESGGAVRTTATVAISVVERVTAP